jgi:hypothetical protein
MSSLFVSAIVLLVDRRDECERSFDMSAIFLGKGSPTMFVMGFLMQMLTLFSKP